MTSIRKFVCVAVMAVTAISFVHGTACAQESAHGKFNLTHDVFWEAAKVPAGEYEFSIVPNGVSPVLMLTKTSGRPARYMVLVASTERTKQSDGSMLVLANMPQGSYVKALQLPDFGMTLDFNVPRSAEKQIAKAASSVVTSGQ